MKNTVTLTKRQRRVFNAIPTEWQNMNSDPREPILFQLEKRGLIEIRLDPTITELDATMRSALGENGHWQVRKTP